MSGVVIPAVPATNPQPALLARISYSEWKGPRPRAVRLAFTLIILAAVLSIAGGVLASRSLVLELPPSASLLERVGVKPGDITAAAQIITLAAAAVASGLYLLLACMIHEGRNWARIGGTVLAGAALVFLLRSGAALQPGAALQTAAAISAICGLALLYRRGCARYFRPRRSQYLGMS